MKKKKVETFQRRDLEQLVNELIKESPDVKLVQDLSEKVGIPFKGDIIDQMSAVLQFAGEIYNPGRSGNEVER